MVFSRFLIQRCSECFEMSASMAVFVNRIPYGSIAFSIVIIRITCLCANMMHNISTKVNIQTVIACIWHIRDLLFTRRSSPRFFSSRQSNSHISFPLKRGLFCFLKAERPENAIFLCTGYFLPGHSTIKRDVSGNSSMEPQAVTIKRGRRPACSKDVLRHREIN